MKPPPMNKTVTFVRPKLGFPAKWLIIAPVAILVLLGLFSSYYTVSPESVAVVQRLGKFQKIAEPGLHFKLPYSIDTHVIVPVRRQLKLEFGFATEQATNPDQASEHPELERDMVTGDLNAAQVEWIIQYSISSRNTSSTSANRASPCATSRRA